MLKDYLEEKVFLRQQNRFLRFFIFLLCISFIINSYIVFRTLKLQKTILVPVGLSRQVIVSSEEVDQAYIEEMTKLIVYHALSYTPQSVEWQFKKLLDLFAPEAYPKYEGAFMRLAKDVKETGVTSSFYITSIEYDLVRKRILVGGYLYQWLQDKKFVTDDHKYYFIDYDVRYGKFMLTGFEECTQNCKL